MSEEIQITEEETTTLPAVRLGGGGGLQLATFEEMWRFSTAIAKSGLAPKGLQKTEAIFVALQLGAEIGLSPMTSMRSIAVINGRAGIYGDTALALVRASGKLVESSYSEVFSGEGDDYGCTVTSQRVGADAAMITRFTIADAKRAKLWGKDGPWVLYPDRMLKFRTRGFNLRDNFGDVLQGLKTTEELRDYPEERNITAAGRDFPAAEEPATAAPIQPPPTKPEPAAADAPSAPEAPLSLVTMADRNAAVRAVLLPVGVTMKSLNEHLRRTGAIAENAQVISSREDTEAFLANRTKILEEFKQENITS